MELEINGKKYNGTITEATLYKENIFDGIRKILPYKKVHKYELNEEFYDDIPEICIVNNRQCYKSPRDNGKFRLIEIIK